MSGSSYYFSENTIDAAMPIWLVDFTTSADAWRYTTCPYAIDYDAHYDQQAGLSIGRIQQTTNERRSQVDISLPWSATLIASLIDDPPEEPIAVRIRRLHVDATWFYQTFGLGTFGSGIFGGHAASLLFSGWVLGHDLQQDLRRRQAVVTCTPWRSDLGSAGDCLRSGLRCQVRLGSTACGVDLSAYSESGTILTVSGRTVTAAVLGGQADGYFSGGVLTCGSLARKIVSHTGSTAVLSHAIASLAVGSGISVTPGCDHVWESDCINRFANGINFRGQPHRQVNIHTQGLL